MYVYVYLFIVYVEFIIGILFLKKSGVGFNYIKILFSSKQRLRTTLSIFIGIFQNGIRKWYILVCGSVFANHSIPTLLIQVSCCVWKRALIQILGFSTILHFSIKEGDCIYRENNGFFHVFLFLTCHCKCKH